MDAEPDMHTPGVAPTVPQEQRLPRGSRVRGRVVCHHGYGLGLVLSDRNEFAHVDVPFIRTGRVRGTADYPAIGSEVTGTVAGYANDQLRVKLVDPTTDPIDSWASVMQALSDRPGVPSSGPLKELVEGATARWNSVVVARLSMHELLFTAVGDRYPFRAEVRVAWRDGVFEFQLRSGNPLMLISADRSVTRNAPLLLESFLQQLVGDTAPDGPMGTSS